MSNQLAVRLILLLCLPAVVQGAPVPNQRPARKNEAVLAQGQTVVLGTWTWKIEGNKLGGGMDKADVWWQQVSRTERNLVPQGGAGWTIFKDKPFEKVSREDLEKAGYSTDKLSGTSLRPGTVIGFRTRDGKFAKWKIVRYRELHDTDFPEARHLRPEWIRFARNRPNTKEYHLEVSWVLYKEK